VSVTWVTRQGWEGGRGVRLWDYLLHTIKSHILHGERKGPTWPISVTLATGTSLREVVVLSSTYSGTDRSDIPSCSRLSCAPKPCRHVNGTV
jgi:hypothetical protein